MVVVDIIVNSIDGERRPELAVPGRSGFRFEVTDVIRRGPFLSRAADPW